MTEAERFYQNCVQEIADLETNFLAQPPFLSPTYYQNKVASDDAIATCQKLEQVHSLLLLIDMIRLGLNKETVDTLSSYMNYGAFMKAEQRRYQRYLPQSKDESNQALPWFHIIRSDHEIKWHFQSYINQLRNYFEHGNYHPYYGIDHSIASVALGTEQDPLEAELELPFFKAFNRELYGNGMIGMSFHHTYFQAGSLKRLTSLHDLNKLLVELRVVTTKISPLKSSKSVKYPQKYHRIFKQLQALRGVTNGALFTMLINAIAKKEPQFHWTLNQIHPDQIAYLEACILCHIPDLFSSSSPHHQYQRIFQILELLIAPKQNLNAGLTYLETLEESLLPKLSQVTEYQMANTDQYLLQNSQNQSELMMAIALLKLGIMCYRFQNRDVDNLPLSRLDFTLFTVDQERYHRLPPVQKFSKIRNALAHGNIDVCYDPENREMNYRLWDYMDPVTKELVVMRISPTQLQQFYEQTFKKNYGGNQKMRR